MLAKKKAEGNERAWANLSEDAVAALKEHVQKKRDDDKAPLQSAAHRVLKHTPGLSLQILCKFDDLFEAIGY